MSLSIRGQRVLAQYFVDTARAFEVSAGNPQAGQNYTANPSVAQIIYDKIIEDGNKFLASINIMPVDDIAGDRVGMDLNGRVISRTDTSANGERIPKHLDRTDQKGYLLSPTEFDVALKYTKIDKWSKFPDFAARYMAMVRRAMGNDMLQVGWSGTSIAADTDIITNPLGQDVNIGWLQLIRLFNSGSQYLLGAAAGQATSVTLGESNKSIGGFINLDSLAKSARDMLPIYHRERDDLVLLVGSDVLSYQEETYYDLNGNTPTEKAVLSARITRAYGTMPTIVPPFFPQSSVMVTPLSNLSIYYQDSSVRRLQKDKPEKNEVQDFNSANQGYVVEDEEMTAFIEGITFK